METASLVSTGKLSKKLKCRRFQLSSDQKEFTFGRCLEAQCIILDVNVSRKHAGIKFIQNQWRITDNKVQFCILICFIKMIYSFMFILFQSKNGVYINQKQIQSENPHALSFGDRISLGPENDYEWRFERDVSIEQPSTSTKVL